MTASRSASARTIRAELPPSSRCARLRWRPAASPTARPAPVEPVKEMTGTSGSATSAWPAAGPAGQHVEDVLWQTRGGEDGREGEPAADRRAGVRLEDDGVAECEGRGDGADGEDERGVERRDDADDTGRDAACVRKAGRLAGQDLAGGPGREGGGLVALLGGDVQLEVGLARDGSRLSHEPGAQLVGVLGEQVARAAQDGGAREVGLPGPVALGRRSGPRRGADVVRGGEGDGGEALARGGLRDRVLIARQRAGLPGLRVEQGHAGSPIGH